MAQASVGSGRNDPFDLDELLPGGAVNDRRRYYGIAGITVQVESDLPYLADTFKPKFEAFAVDGPGEDTVVLHHHFALPGLDDVDLGRCVWERCRGPSMSRRGGGPTWAFRRPTRAVAPAPTV